MKRILAALVLTGCFTPDAQTPGGDEGGDGSSGLNDTSGADGESSTTGGSESSTPTDDGVGPPPGSSDGTTGTSSAGEDDSTTAAPCEEERFYLDADSDGYGDPDDFIDACEPVGAYQVQNDGDCCDADGDANPDQVEFDSSVTACGGYDWNCDGVEEQWVDTCIDPGGCASFWTSCPVPACGNQGDLIFEEPAAGGLCSVANILASQRCR